MFFQGLQANIVLGEKLQALEQTHQSEMEALKRSYLEKLEEKDKLHAWKVEKLELAEKASAAKVADLEVKLSVAELRIQELDERLKKKANIPENLAAYYSLQARVELFRDFKAGKTDTWEIEEEIKLFEEKYANDPPTLDIAEAPFDDAASGQAPDDV